MKQESKQPIGQVPIQRLWSFALMTVVALTTFAIVIISTEPSWLMWFFGALMVLSATAFWSSYAFYRWRNR